MSDDDNPSPFDDLKAAMASHRPDADRIILGSHLDPAFVAQLPGILSVSAPATPLTPADWDRYDPTPTRQHFDDISLDKPFLRGREEPKPGVQRYHDQCECGLVQYAQVFNGEEWVQSSTPAESFVRGLVARIEKLEALLHLERCNRESDLAALAERGQG